jgi:hypothetical protein
MKNFGILAQSKEVYTVFVGFHHAAFSEKADISRSSGSERLKILTDARQIG